MKNLLGWILIMLSAFFETYSALIVKLRFNAMGNIDFNSLDRFLEYMDAFLQSPILITGGVAFFVAPACWFVALNRIQLSIGYPVLVGFHLLFVAVLGILFLDEPFNISKVMGFVFVLLSLYFFRNVEK